MTIYRIRRILSCLLLLRFFRGSSSLIVREISSIRSALLLRAVTQRQQAIWDGSELDSLNQYFQSQIQPIRPQTQDKAENDPHSSVSDQSKIKLGVATIIAGTIHGTQDRVVGILKEEMNPELNPKSKDQLLDFIQVDSNTFIYKDSMAFIPKGLSDVDAICTLHASLVGVHCVFYPTINHVGGSSENMTLNLEGRTIVVLGGGYLASFISEGLSILGAKVVQITNSMIGIRKLAPAVSILSPLQRMGNVEVGFAASVGTFDVLVDCMSDESNSLEGRSIILRELERRHGCQRYVSTVCHSQRIVRDEGLLFGPKLVDKYLQGANSIILSSSPLSSTMDLFHVTPPVGFGQRTLQKLLDARSLFTQRQQFQNILYHSWSLNEFFELTSWPRDTTGGGKLRFGLPVTEDIERLFSDDARERPMKQKKPTKTEDDSEIEDTSELSNNLVNQISSLDELDRDIISTKKTCIIFLSASYCRTCKGLTPKYNRFARQCIGERNMNVTFVKAEVTGASGKILSRALDVDAVPAFVMFRRGKLYGESLSISRIPSKKLDLAIEYLTEGKQWDRKAFETIDS